MSVRVCEHCNQNPAMYVCKDCGRTVCGLCFNPYVWKCQDCSKSAAIPSGMRVPESVQAGLPWGFTIFIAAFIMIFVGMLLMILASAIGGGGTGGLVIFIGPFPIAVGAGPQSSLMIVIAFALAIMGMILFFLFVRRRSV